jgi:hypothetical protein
MRDDVLTCHDKSYTFELLSRQSRIMRQNLSLQSKFLVYTRKNFTTMKLLTCYMSANKLMLQICSQAVDKLCSNYLFLQT